MGVMGIISIVKVAHDVCTKYSIIALVNRAKIGNMEIACINVLK